MRLDAGGAPHVPAPIGVQRVMLDVLLALIPGIAAYVYFFGPGILIQIVLAVTFALALEAAMLRLRGRPLQPNMSDLSAPLTAVLYVLCLPPIMPWWTVLIGMIMAIVVAKHIYGGLGQNLFNPAMVGYAAILISWPLHASTWLSPAGLNVDTLTVGETWQLIFSSREAMTGAIDAFTQATPLDLIRNGSRAGVMLSEVRENPIFGDFGGRGWEWIAILYALGGLYLLYRRVISWHVPVAMIATLLALTLPFYAFDPDSNPLPLQQLFAGGMILGAFFIATDPVSGSTTPRGRLIFGIGVAVITLAIRRWGGFPDGVAFGVLIMNMAVPLIDKLTVPRIYGEKR